MKKLISFACICAAVLTFSAFTHEKEPGYTVGSTARDFKLKNVDGKMVSMADYKTAKGIILVFTCNHCPFAQAYENRVIALHQKYASKGFPVVAINPNDKDRVPEDSYESMVQRAKEHKY